MLSSDASEREMGATAYGEYKAQTKPSADASQQALLARVGAAVKDAAGDTGFEWEFTVLQSDEVNAFCLPGGKVAVYTGIMTKFANEAELACVVAHEVGHAIARHGGERMSWSQLQAIGTLGLSLVGCSDQVQQVYGIPAGVRHILEALRNGKLVEARRARIDASVRRDARQEPLRAHGRGQGAVPEVREEAGAGRRHVQRPPDLVIAPHSPICSGGAYVP